MANRAPRRKRRKQKQEKAFEAKQISTRRPFLFFALAGLLLAGVPVRLSSLDRSLWLDEAWVANSIQSASLYQSFYYDHWLQTTPPLFITISRLITNLFGTSNIAFRALPALAGIASILLFSVVALRLLKPSYAMTAILLFVFNPRLILYSQSLKQYSTDVFSTVSFMVLGHMYMERRTDRWFYALLAGFMALSFLAYPTILFFPFLLYAAVARFAVRPDTGVDRRTVYRIGLRLALAVAAGCFVGAINYWFFIQPNKSPALVEFFLEGFHQGGSMSEFLKFYGRRLLTVPGMLFFGGPGPLPFVGVLIVFMGFLYPWLRRTTLPDLENSGAAILLALPIAGSIALNLLGMFPLPGFDHRLLVFVFPTLVLAFALGLQHLARLACDFIASRIESFKTMTGENVVGATVFAGTAILGLLAYSSVGLQPYFAEEREDSEQAVAYLAQRVQANDVLYVHSSMREQFRLYSRTTPVNAGRIVYGKVGMPCCPRNDYRSPAQESLIDIADEVAPLAEASNSGSLWLLMTDRPLHWFEMRRNDIEIFERGLARASCARTGQARLAGVYAARFGCKPK